MFFQKLSSVKKIATLNNSVIYPRLACLKRVVTLMREILNARRLLGVLVRENHRYRLWYSVINFNKLQVIHGFLLIWVAECFGIKLLLVYSKKIDIKAS